MHFKILWGLLLMMTLPGRLQGDPLDRFFGGSYDGSASSFLQGYNPPPPGALPRYTGNGYDGFALATRTGYTPPAPGVLVRYTGSGYDGFASGYRQGYTTPLPGDLARFRGNGYDGVALGELLAWSPPPPGSLGRFVGGSYDGFDESTSLDLPNPLSGDSDGDGVPDWWEGYHYRSITLAAAATDLDGDGDGSWKEYMADTDPNDFLSRFHLTATGDPPHLTCTAYQTSDSRRYHLEYSRTLAAGSWIPLTDPPLAGNGGDLPFPTIADHGEPIYVRAQVTLP